MGIECEYKFLTKKQESTILVINKHCRSLVGEINVKNNRYYVSDTENFLTLRSAINAMITL